MKRPMFLWYHGLAVREKWSKTSPGCSAGRADEAPALDCYSLPVKCLWGRILTTTIWKRASAADVVLMPGRGWQDRAGDRAEQPEQHHGGEGTSTRWLCYIHPWMSGEKPHQGLVHRNGDAKSEPTFCKVSRQDGITLLLTSFPG